MMKKVRGLGRGLDALLGGEPAAAAPAGGPASVAVAALRPGRYQPRTKMNPESLAELADSIRAQGVMQPILVRPVDADRYEIIAGERRFRAAQMAGLTEVPVIVRDVPDEAALAMALIENIQREDLNPLEEAQGVQRLIREFDFTHEQAAEAIGRSRSATSNLLRLLNLAAPVQEMLMGGQLDMGHARRLRDPGAAGSRDRDQGPERARGRDSGRETRARWRTARRGAGTPRQPRCREAGGGARGHPRRRRAPAGQREGRRQAGHPVLESRSARRSDRAPEAKLNARGRTPAQRSRGSREPMPRRNASLTRLYCAT
jgi:ParB/RepB/Spo0J family partition protein